jgi:hypothetical protein
MTATSSGRLPTMRSALSSAASMTIAVPCWSSWKTGMSSSARSRRSISKQRGAEMSSRLCRPKVGAAARTKATISSTSLVSRHSSKVSTPANYLNIALPSITGIGAAGPMSPRPSTAVPSETPATVLLLIVSAHAFAVVVHGHRNARDAAGVGHREVVAGLEPKLGVDLDLAALVHQEDASGDAVDRHRSRARAVRTPPRHGRSPRRRRSRRGRDRALPRARRRSPQHGLRVRDGVRDPGERTAAPKQRADAS